MNYQNTLNSKLTEQWQQGSERYKQKKQKVLSWIKYWDFLCQVNILPVKGQSARLEWHEI